MSKYAGTKTEANLRAAFAGESQARNQYTFFASVAKKEGYEQMAALFLKTAENEKEHAKLWLKELSGIGDTKANLAAAAELCVEPKGLLRRLTCCQSSIPVLSQSRLLPTRTPT